MDGIVPQDWKRANVCPVHKKGSRIVAGNYRPISLTSQLCKFFEFIMREELISHLENLHLIYESQHGFRRGRSCLSNILTFLEKATKAVDDGLSLDVIYLDLAKAFDKVPHERLLRKLVSHVTEGEVRSNSAPNFSIVSLRIMQLCEYVFPTGFPLCKPQNGIFAGFEGEYVKNTVF